MIFATKKLNEKYDHCDEEIEAISKKYNKNKTILLVNIRATKKEINMCDGSPPLYILV